MDKSQDCDVCYQIRCRNCNWIANDDEVCKIQNNELTACPVCGWKPGEEIVAR